MMTASEPMTTLPAGARVALIAGGGQLPADIADALAGSGHPPFVFRVQGEATADLSGYPGVELPLEAFARLVPILKRERITHLAMAGSIARRPELRALEFGWSLLPIAFRIARALLSGDDRILSTVIGYVERHGIRVVGAHEILPDLLAGEGVLTRLGPAKGEQAAIRAAMTAARAIGALDIGQAAVAVGSRAVALEGAEGTAAMLARVRDLKASGRVNPKAGGVLAKCVKPGQERRADLPTIGPDTVDAAVAAGLAGIAVEAGGALVLQAAETIARADAAGLFVIGIRP